MNTHWRHADRLAFQVITDRWDLLAHVDLHAIAWVNINMKQVTFTTLTK